MAVFYDPRYQTWHGWASLICEQYAAQSLGEPSDEKSWVSWANNLKGIDTFAKNGIPSPALYDNWQEWAMQFGAIMSLSE
jgi:hypothetical protein